MTKKLKPYSGTIKHLQKNGADLTACRRIQIDSYSSLKSKWIKDLNIKPETLNLMNEKVGICFEYTGTEDKYLNRTPLTGH